MFESVGGRKQDRRIAPPMLSFALHASIIALAVGQTGGQDEGMMADPIHIEDVIYDPDASGSGSEVASGTELPLPGPVVCTCEIILPGPLQLDDPVGRIEAIPGLPVPNSIGSPSHSILDPGQNGIPGVYTEGDLTDSPRMVHFPDPVYPPALKEAGVEGSVQMIYVVDSLGNVEPGSVVIVSSDHPLMTESIRSALVGTRFLPGKLRGRSVRTLVRQSVRFSLMSL